MRESTDSHGGNNHRSFFRGVTYDITRNGSNDNDLDVSPVYLGRIFRNHTLVLVMRVNQSCSIPGIHRRGERYYVNVTLGRYAGPRVKRHYFSTIEEAIAFKRANKDIVKL